MDSVTGHPEGLDDDLFDGSDFINLKFIPINPTPHIQPIDQQVISNLKKLNARILFQKCFEVTNDTPLRRREHWKDHITLPELHHPN